MKDLRLSGEQTSNWATSSCMNHTLCTTTVGWCGAGRAGRTPQRPFGVSRGRAGGPQVGAGCMRCLVCAKGPLPGLGWSGPLPVTHAGLLGQLYSRPPPRSRIGVRGSFENLLSIGLGRPDEKCYTASESTREECGLGGGALVLATSACSDGWGRCGIETPLGVS